MAIKPVKVHTYLVQNFLVMLSAALTLLGFVFSSYNVTFWNGSWGVITHGSIEQHLILGVVPLANLGYFFSFTFIYLLFEFYGFKQAFYSAFNLGLLVLGTYGLFLLLKMLPLDNADIDTYREYRDFLTFSLKDIYSIVAAIIGGNIVTFLIAATLKKLTRNYFMFFRYTIASLCGFAAFVAIRIFLVNFNILAPISMLMLAATPMAQFALGVVGMIIPLYILRMILGIFRGKGEDGNSDTKTTKKGGGIFKTDSSSTPVLTPSPAAAFMPPAVAAPGTAVPQPPQQSDNVIPLQPGPNGGTILFPAKDATGTDS